MLLYHGSNIEVSSPQILESDRRLDFGKGFYLTSSYEQAKRWAELTVKRRGSGKESVSVACENVVKAPVGGPKGGLLGALTLVEDGEQRLPGDGVYHGLCAQVVYYHEIRAEDVRAFAPAPYALHKGVDEIVGGGLVYVVAPGGYLQSYGV